MREILFKGKLLCGKGWAFGNLRVDKKGYAIITPDETPLGIYGVVDPETVCQYTGLTDKNGAKIFEGDIVIGRFAEEIITGSVTYGSDAMFFVERNGTYGISLNNASDWLRIIGNIHDKEVTL